MVISSLTHIHHDIAGATISKVHISLNQPLSSEKRNNTVEPLNPLLMSLHSSCCVKNLLPGTLSWEVVSRTATCPSLKEAGDDTSYRYHFTVVVDTFSINSLHGS